MTTTISPGPWRAGNDGSGKLKWFVWRPKDRDRIGGPPDIHSGKSGMYVRFASRQSAQKAADRLNAE